MSEGGYGAPGARRWTGVLVGLAIVAWSPGAWLPPALAQGASLADDSLTFRPFGQVHLYRPAGEPSSVILFVSGDGGWNLGVVGMARAFARQGALVVGIDIRHYLRTLEAAPGPCGYPASDLEALSQFVQQRLDLPRYDPPILIGYSSGASLVYAVLAQAPPNTFRGAVSLGFCPSVPLRRALCPGTGLRTGGMTAGERALVPTPGRSLPWVVLQGDQDEVCDPAAARAFVAQVPGAELVRLPRVGHGFGVEANWLSQLEAAVRRLASAPGPDGTATAGSVRDLPLVEVPARGAERDLFAVMLSGDGGWAGLDREVAGVLADSGIRVVGWNALQYFWKPRTPVGVAADLTRVIRAYATQWGKRQVVLAGYSRGASVLPAAVNLLAPDVRAMIALVALVAPADHVSLAFHATDLVFDRHRDSDLSVVPEVRRLAVPSVLCFYGSDETDTACPGARGARVTIVAMPGGHHLGGRYRAIGEQILGKLR